MIGIDRSGAIRTREPRPSRWSSRPQRVDEVAGGDAQMVRNALMVRLSLELGVPTSHIAMGFGVSDRWVRQIVRDFRVEILKREDAG